MNIRSVVLTTLSTIISIVLLNVSFTVAAAQNATRIVKLGSPPDAHGTIMIVDSAAGRGARDLEIFINFSKLGCPDGNVAYGLYMWTSSGRTRLTTFCPSNASGSYQSSPAVANDRTLLTNPICFEVWRETDDGYDAPDSSGTDWMVLQGEDGAGYPCTDLKQ